MRQLVRLTSDLRRRRAVGEAAAFFYGHDMILVITQSHYANAGVLLRHWRAMGCDAFIFNIDRFDAYRFEWKTDRFHIADPLDREIG